MATLILGTVGRVFGGPIGGLIGTAVGSLVDSRIFSSGRAREPARMSNPAVQSATYGEPIPIISGRMRTAGNLIWTRGIIETAAAAGGGKRSGATTNYIYSASFAVGLAARAIIGVGRIWADGRLVRGAGGGFVTPIVMRLHTGGANQLVDPLIAAAEGVDGTPAYRGLAYAVFEDLPVADYGNRIPNLTFEIIADDGAIDAGVAIAAIAAAAGYAGLTVSGGFPAMTGHIAGRVASLADALAPLISIADVSVQSHDGLAVTGNGGVAIDVPGGAGDAHRPGDNRPAERVRRLAAESVAGTLELSFYDVSRDYQPGLQRVRQPGAAPVDGRAIAAAMTPVEAKALAAQLLATAQAARARATLRLAWRHVGLVPGTLVRVGGSAEVWRVREARFENFIVHLDLERIPALRAASDPAAALRAGRVATLGRAADGGRSLAVAAVPAGATELLVLDLPGLAGEMPVASRLWIAGTGAGAGWRRAGVAISRDDGASYATLGVLEGGSVIGTALTVLGDSGCAGWDRFSSVEVEVRSERDWLEGMSPAAVLAGGNLALLGDELFQFSGAQALGPRRFRLHGLLRGRRGTEVAATRHRVGERFVLIDPQRMLAIEAPLEMLGRTGRVKAIGAGDADTEAVMFAVGAAALRPLAPVHLAARRVAGDLVVSWVRRSRAGFGWTDFVDAPLGEASEAYSITVIRDGQVVRQASSTVSRFVYTAADVVADGGTEIRVAQCSADVGPGAIATIAIDPLLLEAI